MASSIKGKRRKRRQGEQARAVQKQRREKLIILFFPSPSDAQPCVGKQGTRSGCSGGRALVRAPCPSSHCWAPRHRVRFIPRGSLGPPGCVPCPAQPRGLAEPCCRASTDRGESGHQKHTGAVVGRVSPIPATARTESVSKTFSVDSGFLHVEDDLEQAAPLGVCPPGAAQSYGRASKGKQSRVSSSKEQVCQEFPWDLRGVMLEGR